jgi:uncharacterized protein YjbI with pentapeptide repeats
LGDVTMKKRLVVIPLTTLFCLLVMASVVYGFDHTDVDKLMETKQCPRCDLSEANLGGLKVPGKDLDRANLSKANLNQADLSKTDMSGADLSGANLSGANLSEADLSGTDLSGADLSGADITKTNLDGAKLDNALWIDGERCKEGSVETCDKEEKK